MLEEVQYEQVDVHVPTADTGFTMSTNTAYSNTDKNAAYGTSIGLNDVSVYNHSS